MSSDPPPRRFRLQFTLRSILFLMGLVGAGLAIYRWPWMEVRLFLEQYPETKEVTSYHRGWNGKPVKHGVQTTETLPSPGVSKRFVTKKFYVDDELRREEEWEDGKLCSVQNYRGGALDGPSWIKRESFGAENDAPILETATEERGTYRQGKMVGEWVVRYQYDAEDDAYTSIRPFADDQPHGEWLWKDDTGKVLQSAHFERGELVSWNGRELPGALEEWFVTQRISPTSRSVLAQPAGKVAWFGYESSNWIGHFGVTEYSLDRPGQKQQPKLELAHISRFVPQGFLQEASLRSARQPAEALALCLLRSALLENYTFVSRADVLCLARITYRQMDPRVKTGIPHVKFAPDSAQAADWLSLPTEPLPEEHLDSGFLQALFAGTSIQIDASEIPTNPPTEKMTPNWMQGGSRWPPPRCNFHTPHRRCDLLSLLLHEQNWSCEQRGNVLIMHPYPAERD